MSNTDFCLARRVIESFSIKDRDNDKASNSDTLAGKANKVRNNVFSNKKSNDKHCINSRRPRTKSKFYVGKSLIFLGWWHWWYLIRFRTISSSNKLSSGKKNFNGAWNAERCLGIDVEE